MQERHRRNSPVDVYSSEEIARLRGDKVTRLFFSVSCFGFVLRTVYSGRGSRTRSVQCVALCLLVRWGDWNLQEWKMTDYQKT